MVYTYHRIRKGKCLYNLGGSSVSTQQTHHRLGPKVESTQTTGSAMVTFRLE